jgi:predicted esterase
VSSPILQRLLYFARNPSNAQAANIRAIRRRYSSHRVSKFRLKELATSLPSSSRIAIIHGTEDNLIDVNRGKELNRDLPVRSLSCVLELCEVAHKVVDRSLGQGSTLKIVEGGGHALPSQITEEYNAWIKDNIERTV